MPDSSIPPNKGSWFATILGTLAGLFAGAVLMYVSPWVEKITRPPRPVANFELETNGLTAYFHNRSLNASLATWDFGDGSPLEFVPADKPLVVHIYARPGTYVAKLRVNNLLRETDERIATINLEVVNDPARAPEKPVIVDLYARPASGKGQPVYAPTTFHFVATVDHGQFYFWDFGDGGGMRMGEADAIYTFDRPGAYAVKLSAFRAGGERSQQEVSVEVHDPPAGGVGIFLEVTDHGWQVEKRTRNVPASVGLTLEGSEAPERLEQTIVAGKGFELTSVERVPAPNRNRAVDKASLEIAPDRRSVLVTGEVIKQPGMATYILHERLVLTEERRAKASRGPIVIAASLNSPGNATLRLPRIPDDWTDVKRHYALVLRQDGQVIWSGSDLPVDAEVTVKGRKCQLEAALSGEQVLITLQDRAAIP